MFDNLIVGIDGRPGGRDALRLAKQLAGDDARVTLAYIYGTRQGPPGSGSMLIADQHRAAIEMLQREGRGAHPDATIACRRDPSAGRGLHQVVEDLGADLLVVGSSHRGAVGRILLGDDTRAALLGAPCATAIAPRGHASGGAIDRVGVAYDATADSERALACARLLGARLAVPIQTRWVIDLEDVRRQAPLPADWPAARVQLVQQAQRRLDALDGITGRAVAGGTREELLEFAHDVDLLVVGSRGLGPIDSFVHGSISSYLERHIDSALLVLPRPGVAAVRARSRRHAAQPAGSGSRQAASA
ncbi:MAG TPA: universal stress protein [Solirubrobacteraceae bacterium]|nr:universal stress protein [Solirubrobacteraceae bacterium]